MKILITGGAGYIGSHVVKALLKQGKDEITIIDNLCKGSQKALEALQKIGNFKFIKAKTSFHSLIAIQTRYLESMLQSVMQVKCHS